MRDIGSLKTKCYIAAHMRVVHWQTKKLSLEQGTIPPTRMPHFFASILGGWLYFLHLCLLFSNFLSLIETLAHITVGDSPI